MRKDVGTVSPEQRLQGRRQHVVEVCNFVDAGTSIALLAQAREDFHEQTALETVITFLRQYGCPQQMTFDRDPRWVGGVSGRDFPSPLRRLLLCLGVSHRCARHIAPTKMRLWRGFTGLTGKNAYTCINQRHCKRCERSPKRSSSITIMNVPIKDELAAMFLHGWLFRPCPPYQPFQNALTRTPGWPHSIRRCTCVIWAEMAVWM